MARSRTRHRTRLRLSAAVAAATLPLAGLTACTEDEPEANIPSSPTAEPSEPANSETSDEPVEPEPPAAMDKANEAGAKAFVEHYFAAWDYALEAGDVRLLRSLGASSCVSCTRLASSIQRAYKNSAAVSGGFHTVKSLALAELTGGPEGSDTFRGGGTVASTAQRIEGA